MKSNIAGAQEFPYRDNSLNLFRLILAFLVLFAHAYYIVGRSDSPGFNGENLGGWAVAGFFVLSGFLITRSRARSSAADFLLHRVARIFPAFFVVLILTAFVFAPLSALIEQGSLSGIWTTPITPLEYVWGNLRLFVEHYTIGNTLLTVPYPQAWNGSLWTLFYEFACYLVIFILAGFVWFRRSLTLAASLWLVAVVIWANSAAITRLGGAESLVLLSRLLPYFLAGAVVYLTIERFGLRPLLGWVAIPVAGVVMTFVPVIGGQLAAPAIAYALLYLSTVIPQPGWVARNDVSYGFYVYAWPIQQMTALLGGTEWPFAIYVAVTAAVTIVFAWLSWNFVERPVMARARRARSSGHAAPSSGTTTT